MFINPGRLPYLLESSAYHSPTYYADELRSVFASAWHIVARRAELARSGDFVTVNVAGEPVIVRNFDGELIALHNVCAHRQALLSSKRSGNAQQLRCQYHGWQYDNAGYVCDIPDRVSFGAVAPREFRVRRFRVCTIGPLVAVSVAASPPELLDWLGPAGADLASALEGASFADAWTADEEANWKILVENSLESYHLPAMHASSFGVSPNAAEVRHVLGATWSSFENMFDLELRLVRHVLSWASRWLDRAATHTYRHVHIYPNLTFSFTDWSVVVQSIEPRGPTSSRMSCWVFTRALRTRAGLLLRPIVRWAARYTVRRVYSEDRGIYAAVQAGIEKSQQRGVLSCREERIYDFQRWLRARHENCVHHGADHQP